MIWFNSFEDGTNLKIQFWDFTPPFSTSAFNKDLMSHHISWKPWFSTILLFKNNPAILFYQIFDGKLNKSFKNAFIAKLFLQFIWCKIEKSKWNWFLAPKTEFWHCNKVNWKRFRKTAWIWSRNLHLRRKFKSLAGKFKQCFAFTPQANFLAHNLNFHWRWRW